MAMPLRSRPHPAAQRGVVLVVVLIMLVVIAFMSVGVMRGALTSDLITNNNRTQTLAAESAQLALRFCEEDLRKVGSTVATPALFLGTPPILPASTTYKTGSSTEFAMAWENQANWTGNNAAALTLSDAQMKSANTSFTPPKRPQCLAEFSPEPGTAQIVVLTVRGFSPDYDASTTTSTTNKGSVVWLQSRLLFARNPITP